MVQITEDTFDLIHCDLCLLLSLVDDDAVRPALQTESELLTWDHYPQRHLGMVFRSHPALDLPVDPAAQEHRFPVRAAGDTVVDIPFSQDKLYQIPN